MLIINYSFSQNDSKIEKLKKRLEQDNISKSEKSKALSALSYNHSNIDSSLFFAEQALAIAREINDANLQADALQEISHVEYRLGNNSKSLDASLRALRIYDSLGLTELKAAIYGQLANNSLTDKDYNSAITYLKNAEHIYTISDKRGNLILTQLNLGEAYRLEGQLDSAAIYFKETLEKNKTKNNNIVQGYSLGNLGMVLRAQESFDVAEWHLVEAIAILEPLGDAYSTSVYLTELGRIYWKTSQWNLAEAKLLSAYHMANEAGLKEQIRDFSRTLTDFYKERQQYDKALDYLEINRIYQDSLVNKASIQQIEQLKANYEIGKRESEISLLNTVTTNQRNQMILLGIGVLFISVLALMLFRGNRAIKKVNERIANQNIIIEKREQEKALLLKELNHRVKNNLQMISSLLSLQSHELSGHPAQEALLAGKHRVEALSLVHRKLYQEGAETKIALKEYIEELVLGLFYGYNVPFKPKLSIDNSSISIDKAIPLALIINEIVVNSLKYAYADIKAPSLEITVKEVAQHQLELDISDNGIGFTEKEGDKKNSFGLKLIHSLIGQLDGHIERLKTNGTHWKIKLGHI
ncbi:tetratricopeptide repeat-containing sensor histidine kinase [Winogradskyella sp.]|uniref:tetratricopeptide repeat-containing sensor histidine kinase n=1 Tax=Winogradskyella sp. TaxID=1883156 RepID=UPI003BAC5F99